MNGGEMSSEPGEPSEAIGHLQAAALEMISAARAFLEVAEKVVQNPETVRSAVVTVASLAKAVMQSVDNGSPSNGETGAGTNGDDPPSRWSTSSSHEVRRAAHARGSPVATAPSARGHRGERGDPRQGAHRAPQRDASRRLRGRLCRSARRAARLRPRDVAPARSRPRTRARARRCQHPDRGVWLCGTSPGHRRRCRDQPSRARRRSSPRGAGGARRGRDHARRASRGGRTSATGPPARSPTASDELADAIASRDAAYRAVEALADAAQDDPDDDIVEVELVVEEPPDVDPWAEQRVTRLQAVDVAERRVLEARAEVEQSARAANPARLDQHDRAALEAAHDAVLDADERAGRRLGGASARKRLDEARAAERVVLDRLGLDSYSDFLLRSSMGRDRPERGATARDRTNRADGGGTSADGGPRRLGSCSRPPALGTRCRGSSGGRRSTCSPEGVAAGRVGRGRGPTRRGDPSS